MPEDRTHSERREAWMRQIPSVDRCLALEGVRRALDTHPRTVVVQAIRDTLAALRQRVLESSAGDEPMAPLPGDGELAAEIVDRASARMRPYYRRVVNATGIILHTGLGRARIADEARRAMHDEAGGYAVVEIDPASAERTVRTHALRPLLQAVTGAEAGIVVNNNAAATMLILNTLADGREVIVSRGQLVEIGGSYRMPDVMEKAGTILVGVGTTNRTHLADYERAIHENTGAIFRAHTSNYRIIGFTKDVSIEDLARLGKKHGIPVVDDLGSGALLDLARIGLPDEPVVRRSLEAGADLVCFSGDKLIGGPQAGIIVGSAEWIERIEQNALTRAFRVDKMTLAGIEATLKMFLDEERLFRDHPTLRMASLPLEDLKKRAASFARKVRQALPDLVVEIREEASQLGSGSLPTVDLPTRAVAIRCDRISTEELARRLRVRQTPIFARVKNDELLIDPRTLQEGEDEILLEALREIHESHGG